MWSWRRKKKVADDSVAMIVTEKGATEVKCPKCGATEFQAGPRCVMGRNFRCKCGAIILVSPMGVELIS